MPTSRSTTPPTLSADALERIADAVRSALYNRVFDLVTQVGQDVMDELRFAPLAAEFAAARQHRGLDLKAAAKALKRPQYVVRQIEQGKLAELDARLLDRYSDALGMKDQFGRWKLANPELALRMGRPKGESPLLPLLEHPVLAAYLESARVSPPPATTTSQGFRGARAGHQALHALELKIVLQGVTPLIWRRVLVTDDTTLHGLHEVIQVAMGWTDTHLYRFEVDDGQYFDLEVLDDPDPEDRDARAARLADLGLTNQSSFLYEYDFGDGWSHLITVERVEEVEAGAPSPRCLAGARACPPEDCGGPHGYDDLLSALADPVHPEHKELRRWAPKGFHPETYNVETANAVLAGRRRRGRSR